MRLLIADFGLWIEKQKHDRHHKISGYAEKLLVAFSAPISEPQSTIVQQKAETLTPAQRSGASAGVRNQQSEMVDPLSEREGEVLKLLGTELSGPEIARKLHVSLNTLRTHTKNIYSKLGVSNRRAAIRRAEELGLL